LTLEYVKDKWEEVLTKIKEYNNSLASVLKACRPSVISEGSIILEIDR